MVGSVEHLHTELQGLPFRDPSEYPPLSVAASGTHDTEPLVAWWDAAPQEERHQIGELPTVHELTGGAELSDATFNPLVRDALLEALFASGSNLLLLPIQDAFGWSDRINEPATVTESNWTFKLPWPSDRIGDMPDARERQQALRRWAAQYGRL